MKKIIFNVIPTVLFVALSSLIVSASYAVQDVVIYGDDSYPPYSFLDKDSKSPKGIYVDILNKAFLKMPDYNVKISMIPWKRGINYVKTGKGVAIFPPYYSEERVPWMNYSEPLLAEKVIVFSTEKILKGKQKWPDDFFGLRGGINLGFSVISMGGKSFADAIKAGKITLDEAKSNDVCLKKLSMGRIHFYLNDQLIDISMYPNIVRSNIVTNKNHGYLGFTRKLEQYPYIPELKQKFDEIIKKMKSDGDIEQIIQPHKK